MGRKIYKHIKGGVMKKYLILDGRGDIEKSAIFEVCDTPEEAEKNKSFYGADCVVEECEMEILSKGVHDE